MTKEAPSLHCPILLLAPAPSRHPPQSQRLEHLDTERQSSARLFPLAFGVDSTYPPPLLFARSDFSESSQQCNSPDSLDLYEENLIGCVFRWSNTAALVYFLLWASVSVRGHYSALAVVGYDNPTGSRGLRA